MRIGLIDIEPVDGYGRVPEELSVRPREGSLPHADTAGLPALHKLLGELYVPDWLPEGFHFRHANLGHGNQASMSFGKAIRSTFPLLWMFQGRETVHFRIQEGMFTPKQIAGHQGVFVEGIWENVWSHSPNEIAPIEWRREMCYHIIWDMGSHWISLFALLQKHFALDEVFRVAESVRPYEDPVANIPLVGKLLAR